MRHWSAIAIMAGLFLALPHIAGAQPDVSEQLKPAALPAKIAAGETVYVPVYSHIYMSNTGKRYLAATLVGITLGLVNNVYSQQGERPVVVREVGVTCARIVLGCVVDCLCLEKVL